MPKKCAAQQQHALDVRIACPSCRLDITETGELSVYDYVDAISDPEGKARLDLLFQCQHCEQEWNAFVPLEEFFRNPIDLTIVRSLDKEGA